MGTRALVGYLDTNGDLKLTSTYNHYDGYPSNLGKGLETFYNTDAKAEEIANVGYISFLDGETGEWDAKNQQMPDITQLPDNFDDAMVAIAEEIEGMSADYGYIWDNENQEWITLKNRGILLMAKDLEVYLFHLKGKFEMSPESTMEAKHEMKENFMGNTNVESYIGALGYSSFDEFFEDNPGAEDALISWMEKIPDFRDTFMEKGLLEAKKDKAELEEYFINKMKFRAGIIK